jgi:hypothetical protein
MLDEYEPKEVTKLVTSAKCIRRVLAEFPDVMPEDLPPRRWVDHAIEVMLGLEPPAKAPYRMSHEELKELKVQLEKLLAKGISNQASHHMGHPSFLFTRRMGF